MTVTAFNNLACPLDGDALVRDDNRWVCPAGHSFDAARQGYIHLLPVQNKRSKSPGDSKEMVAARQRFLGSAFYQPIAALVAGAACTVMDPLPSPACLDAGCGEGYYLRFLADQFPAERELRAIGLDISKEAILAAARQDKRPRWLVGSNANLPVLPGTVDCLLSLFGFPVYLEFLRVLKAGGSLLQVDAGPDHLRQLREIVYPELKPARAPGNSVPEGFLLEGKEQLRFDIHLPDNPAIQDLLAMTPHLYRASKDGRVKALALDNLTVTVDVLLTHLKKA